MYEDWRIGGFLKTAFVAALLIIGLLPCNAQAQTWQQGFDFRNTSNYVTDPPGDTYVLATTGYPTTVGGVTFGWANPLLVFARDRSTTVDPRLAGIDYAENGTPATFYVNLPSAGTYNLSLAMGDAGYIQCWTQCRVQFLDGSTVVGTVTEGETALGYFYDATGRNWSATAWPANNVPLQVTMTGTRLSVVVGTNNNTGDITPIAYLGVAQTTAIPNFTISASPTALSVVQGNQGTSTITTAISGGFDSAISLSAAGAPAGTTVSFSPNPIAAPGSGSSTMTMMVGSNTPVGTYPITVTGNGGGVQQTTTVTLTVTAPVQPDFTITASPAALNVGQGNQGTSTITTTIMGGFNSAISLSSSGAPMGSSVSFNPTTIAAPGAGTSTMTITVGSSTPLGTYPITVTGSGGGKQHNVTVTLTVTSAVWQQGFDFRNTANYVTDPPGDTYVLATTAYPTTVGGVTFGWANPLLVFARDRSTTVDPRLAGMDYAENGTPATFYVNLPSAGTYNLSLALGDAGYAQCWTQCEVQFLDGSRVVGTVTGGLTGLGYFYDATGRNWSATAWPTNNVPLQVMMTGTRLSVVVGTNNNTGDITPIAYLGVAQTTAIPNFTISASPAALSVVQGNQGTSTITTAISGGFDSAISLSAAGAPAGTTVSFSPNPIAAPGSGSSTMTMMVGSNTPVGTYPITVTGNGGGVQQTTTVTLTVTAPVQPDFTITASPAALNVGQGNQGTSTITTTIMGGFNSAISLSSSGAPMGSSVSFNPTTIAAPGAGTSTMTITVGSSTPLGTYPITVTGSGGGKQHNVTVTLTVTSAVWQQGFDFRGTSGYVLDPPGDTYVLPGTIYPTTGALTTYGWTYQSVVSGSNRSTSVDPRLAGINYAENGTPATFYVNLPSAGTYSLSLAMGDDGYTQCWTQCQVQFLDGSRVVGTLAAGPTLSGYFWDAVRRNWSAAAWPGSNAPMQVTMTGTLLTVVVGTNNHTGDITPLAFLGVTQLPAAPTFALVAPSAISVGQGEYTTADVSTVLIDGFSGAITLSTSGGPVGTSVNFQPNPIPSPGAGTSTLTISVPSGAALGNYSMTLSGTSGAVIQNIPITLTVTAPQQPGFTVTNSPNVLGVAPGSAGNSTLLTTLTGSFNSAVALSSSGAPPGTTVTFNPTVIPAPGDGSSTVTITVPSGARLGSYPIVLTGSGGGVVNNSTVTLTISANGGVNLPNGTGWVPLGSQTVVCSVSPGATYYNPQVGEVDALDFLSLCQEGSLVAYGGGAADTTNDRYFLWTSGHNNYQGNEMYAFNFAGPSLAVSRITDPSWTVDNTDVPPDCACKGTYNCGQGMWHDGAGNPVNTPYAESAYNGVHFESTPAPDGTDDQPSCGYGPAFQPNAREIYAGMVYHSTTNKVFAWGGVTAANPAAGGAYSNWKLDLNQDPPLWTRLANQSYAWYTAATYDYTTGHNTSGYDLIFDEDTTLYAYHPATDTYVTLANSLPYIGYNVNIELDPLHHSLVMENGDNYGGYHLKILNLDSCNGTTCTITNLDGQVSCAGTMGYWAGISWDSKRSVMTFFPSASNCNGSACVAPFNTAYLLNTDPNNPVTITYQGIQHTIPPQQCFAASYGSTQGEDYPPISIGPGVYSRFKYFPNEDIYLVIPNPNDPAWILRLE